MQIEAVKLLIILEKFMGYFSNSLKLDQIFLFNFCEIFNWIWIKLQRHGNLLMFQTLNFWSSHFNRTAIKRQKRRPGIILKHFITKKKKQWITTKIQQIYIYFSVPSKSLFFCSATNERPSPRHQNAKSGFLFLFSEFERAKENKNNNNS